MLRNYNADLLLWKCFAGIVKGLGGGGEKNIMGYQTMQLVYFCTSVYTDILMSSF